MTMKQEYQVIVSESVEVDPELTFAELSEMYHIDANFIHELIEFGALELSDYSIDTYHFHTVHVKKIHLAQRLQQELEVNMAGAVLALDLIDEIDALRSKLAIFEKYLERNIV